MDAFLLVASFAKALAHRIRTPLTVVTNELSYLASQGHDCERGIQRAKDIAEILKLACALGSATKHETSLDLSSSITKIFPEIKNNSSFFITCDTAHLEATLRLTSRLLGDLAGESENHKAPPHFSVSYAVSNLAICVFSCQLHDKISVNGEVSSLTELFAEKLHLDLIEPPLIDAGAASCGMKIMATLVDGLFTLRCTWAAAH